MIQRRSDLHFFMITKRPERIVQCLPDDWVLSIREQCIKSNVPFHFKQTGAHFRKDSRLYNIPRNQQMAQAHRAGIDFKQ